MNKPTCKACSALAKAIDAYIAKVDDDLEGELESAGYAEASESVAGASVLEEEITKILGDQSEALADLIKNAGSLEKAKALLDQFFDDDETREKLENLFKEYFSDQLLDLANDYIKESDGQLVVSTLRARTTAWITNWSGQLANLMQLTSKTQMETILQNALDNGESVESVRLKLQNAGIRQEAYRARTASLTEMLRAHSVARQEAIIQSPAVDRKQWRHSGTAKIKPRENHQAIDGQIKPKREPFELTGADGGTYYPMYPRDDTLPPEESINCHCVHLPIVGDDVLAMSLEERQALQQQIIEEDDGEWEKELDARNRALSGIDDE